MHLNYSSERQAYFWVCWLNHENLFLVFHLILYVVGTNHLLSISKHWYLNMGFPCSSVGKESTFNVGHPGSIPGERIGYPLQYSWASLVAQMVNNLPAIQETWIRSLGWEDTLEAVFLLGESPRTEEPGGLQSMQLPRVRVRHDWATKQSMP